MTPILSNTPLDQVSSFNAFDYLLVVVMAWSIVLAFLRGIIREIFGLVGVVLGLLLAAWNYSAFALWLYRWIASPVTAQITAFLLIAVSVMIAFTLLGRLVRATAHTIGLDLFDRLAGGGFGLVRGFLLNVGVLMAATAFFPPQTFVANSRLAPYFLDAAREVSFVLPQNFQARINGGINSVRHIARR